MYEELTPEIEANKDSKDNAKENNKENAKKKNKAKENKKDKKENNKEDTDLIEEKKNDYMIINQPNQIEHSVSIENGSAKWFEYEREDTLQNINIKVKPGELIAIVGQVGAGKSSLLNVILKELRLQEGSIQVR